MNPLLDRIISAKKEELEETKRKAPEAAVKKAAAERGPARGFARAIAGCKGGAVIAELKKASPTKGLLRAEFDVEQLARRYAENGAAALSVLTESRFFMGDISYIERASAVCEIPILRKDFIFDTYQIYEARAAGADAALLIVAALDKPLLSDLIDLAHEVGMDTLVETHDADEIEIAASFPCDIIGVNNRNLKTGKVDFETSFSLAAKIPAGYCKISESGIKNGSDAAALAKAGYKGFLIGEALVTQPDPGRALREFTGVV